MLFKTQNRYQCTIYLLVKDSLRPFGLDHTSEDTKVKMLFKTIMYSSRH